MPDPVTIEEVKEAVGELRKELEKKNADPVKIEKIEKILDRQEDEQKEMKERFVSQKKIETEHKDKIKILEDSREKDTKEYKERIDALEIEIARGPGTIVDEKAYKEKGEYKALSKFMQTGERNLTIEEKQLLRTDIDTQGGYLVPVEMETFITRKIEETSNVRSVARVRTIASKTLNVPIRDTIPQAEYEGEAETGPDDTATYQNEALTPFRQTVTIPITMDMLMDAAFDMESEINFDVSESFAQGEGRGFVTGSGFKQPFGFVSDPRTQAQALEAAAATEFDGDDILTLTGELKTGYAPWYYFNRRTLAFIRKLKDSEGRYLWAPGLNGLQLNTLAGFPYLELIDMPDIALDAFPVAFADLFRGYTIIDRTGMNMIRDDITQKRRAIVEFTFMRWNTGQVTLPEAIKLLKTIA